VKEKCLFTVKSSLLGNVAQGLYGIGRIIGNIFAKENGFDI
jgi:hypothetical protein